MRSRSLAQRARAASSSLLLLAASAVVVGTMTAAPAAANPPSQPNIVVINTDDQRFDSLFSCMATVPEGRTAPTGSTCAMPHVRNDLMAHGVTFTQSFVTTSLCCPSRASLFLGQYAHRTGVYTNDKPNGAFPAFRPLQDSTIARWLHDSGYRTSLVGKYLNGYDVCTNTPTCNVPHGWDDWHAEITDGDVDYTDFQLADSLGNGLASAHSYSEYSTSLLGQKAVSFVQDSLANHSEQPLFLYFAPFAPHPSAVAAAGDDSTFGFTWRHPSPGIAPNSWNQDPTNGPAWSTDRTNNPDHIGTQFLNKRDAEHRNEMESLLEVDRQVHALVQALGSAVDDTLIVFTSDNGLSWGEHRYFDKKNCEFEECHRVPMVVRYDPLTDPGGTGPGRVDQSHPVLNVDVTATAADAGRLTMAQAMDGRSFLPLLDGSSGNDPPDWRTGVLGENYGGMIACSDCVRTPTMRLIRTVPSDPLGAWKFVELCALNAQTLPCATSGRELYDETHDRYEMHNTAVVSPGPGTVQAQLAARLAQIQTTQPPAVSFSQAPPPATPATSATFAFSATAATRYWCSLDGALRTPCTSSVSVPGPLSQGTHTFAVVAEGEAPASGVTGTSAPTVRAWAVDTTAPDTSITAGPSGSTAATAAQFTFTSNEIGATFRCSLDGGPFSTCTSPLSLSNLTEAAHSLVVRAVDAAGNTDPSPASRAWTVDVTAPNTFVDTGPSGSINQPGPFQFTFHSNEGGASFQCRLSPGGSFATCSSPHQVAVPGDGNFTLTVKATDAAGNPDGTPAAQSWTVDTTPPATPSFTQTPSDPSGPSVTFAWNESDSSATFRCTLDGTPDPCASPRSYSSLGNGQHAFSVVATDPAGNPSGAAQHSWTVSTTGPALTIATNQNTPTEGSFTTSTSAKFNFSSNMQGTTYECSLDGAAFDSCSSGVQYGGLSERPHRFSVRGTAGGVTGPPAVRTWTVDLTPPETTITESPPPTTRSPGPFVFRFTSNEAEATFKCKLDGTSFAPCTSPYQVDGPLGGPHTFQVKAADRAGNTDTTPDSRTWTVDTTPPPVPSITSKPPAASASSSASFSFTDTERGVSFTCSLDGAPPTGCSSPQGSTSLPEGQHTFAVRAVDDAGNISNPAPWTWTVDTDPPDTTITDGPGSTQSAQFSFTSDETGSTFQCSIDAAAYASCSSPKGYPNLPDGDHTFDVRAVDPAGNVDPTPAEASWTVEPDFPGTTILTGPDDGSWVGSTSAEFTFSSTLPGATFYCSVDGAAFAPCTSGGAGASPSGLADGPHTFAVFAQVGGAPDPTPATRAWSIDTVAPAASMKAPTADQFVTSPTFAVKWNSTDPAPSSGTRTFALLERTGLDGSPTQVAGGTLKQTTRPVGTTTCWQVTATDPAGNIGTSPERCAALPLDDRSASLASTGPTGQLADDGAFQGTITSLQGSGAQVLLQFAGRKATVVFQKQPSGGKAKIFVDGTAVQTVDTYASSAGQQKFLWTSALAEGSHNVSVAWTGQKASASTGTDVAIDAIGIFGSPT